jgi:hypothetical protein
MALWPIPCNAIAEEEEEEEQQQQQFNYPEYLKFL